MVAAREVDEILMGAVDTGAAPGVVAMAADDGGVVYAGAFGTCEVDRDREMRLDAVVRIATMTKTVTSVAALQLVEQGRIGLDDVLGEHVPELAAVQVLEGFDDDGAPRLRPPRRPITLRHLLTHTAGFGYHFWNTDLLRYLDYAGIPDFSELKTSYLEMPLVCDPGDRWEYGINIDWVGQTIERLGGQRLDDYVQEHLCGPLGMVDTGFVLRPEQRSRLAPRHARQADGSLQMIPFVAPQAPEFLEGGGGLFSTGPDYLRFLRMLLGDGQLDGVRVLRPETVAALSANQIGDLTAGVLTSAEPLASNDVEFFPGMVKKWGLGCMITTEETPTGRAAGSLTWAGMANTYFWIDPTRRVTGLLLTQILPFGDPAVLDLFARFERAIYANRA